MFTEEFIATSRSIMMIILYIQTHQEPPPGLEFQESVRETPYSKRLPPDRERDRED